MIQDIFPKHLNNTFVACSPQSHDTVLFFEGSTVLAKVEDEDTVVYPQYDEFIDGIKTFYSKEAVDNYIFTYLLSIDDERFFMATRKREVLKGQFAGEFADENIHKEFESFIDGYEYVGVNVFRKAKPKEEAFAAITAYHLYGWYRDNRFCGRCGRPTEHDMKLRMLKCPDCGNMIFPKICPAVIVAVTDKDRILLTKYAGRTYKNYALIAGYTEIGETAEETVEREVMEEVGLKVKNIKYYKSQPWALSGSLLTGFFCELDGGDNIKLDEDELAVGTWVKASDIDFEDDGISLTREMILKFRDEYINQQK